MSPAETLDAIRDNIRALVAERGDSGIRAAIPTVQEVHDELEPGSLKRAHLALWLQAAQEVVNPSGCHAACCSATPPAGD